MFKFFQGIKNYQKSREFNAANCLGKQVKIDQENFEKRVEDITMRIKYVVESTTEEHAVIYQVHDYERKMYDQIEEHFTKLGFLVIRLTIPELGNDEYMIISWKHNGQEQ